MIDRFFLIAVLIGVGDFLMLDRLRAVIYRPVIGYKPEINIISIKVAVCAES